MYQLKNKPTNNLKNERNTLHNTEKDDNIKRGAITDTTCHEIRTEHRLGLRSVLIGTIRAEDVSPLGDETLVG